MSSVRPKADVLRHGATDVTIAGQRFRFRIVVDAGGAVVACLPEGPDVLPRVARSCRIAKSPPIAQSASAGKRSSTGRTCSANHRSMWARRRCSGRVIARRLAAA